MSRNQEFITISKKLVEAQLQIVLFAAELERHLDEHETKDQTLEDYRQKAIDMEHNHTQELAEIKEFFEATMKEQQEELENLQKQWEDEKADLLDQIQELQDQLEELQGHRDDLHTKGENLSKEKEGLQKTIEEWMTKHRNLEEESKRMIQELSEKHETQLKETDIQFQKDKSNLINQLESVRRKNRDLESQNEEITQKNASLLEDLNKARIGIEDIESRYNDLEKRYKLENDKLNDHITELKDRLKKAELEKNNLQEENGRQVSQIRDQDSNIKELEDNQRDLLLKIKQLTEEVDRLGTYLSQKQSENDELTKKIRDLELDYVKRFEQLRENLDAVRREEVQRVIEEKDKAAEREREDFYRRLREIQYENDRLLAELSEKEERIKSFIMKQERVKKDHETEIENMHGYFEKRVQAALDDQQAAHLNELSNIQRTLNEQKSVRSELECKVSVLIQEMEKRDREIQLRNDEIAGLKQQVIVTERNKVSEVEELKTLYDQRKRADTADLEVRLSAERSAFGIQVMQLQQKIEELEQNKDTLIRDNTELKRRIEERGKELDQLRMRESSLVSDRQRELEDLRKQLEQFKRLYRESEENRTKNNVDKLQFESQVSQYRIITEQNKAEIQRLYELIEARNKESEALAQELAATKQELNNTKRELRDLDSEYHVLNHRNLQLSKEVEETSKSRDLYKAQWEKNNNDLTAKNKQLIEKIHEVDILRKRYEEGLLGITIGSR